MGGSCLKLTSASNPGRWHPWLATRNGRTAGLLCAPPTLCPDEFIVVLSQPKVEGVARRKRNWLKCRLTALQYGCLALRLWPCWYAYSKPQSTLPHFTCVMLSKRLILSTLMTSSCLVFITRLNL